VGWIRKRDDSGNFEATYRDPSGRKRSKSFRTKAEAKAFLAAVETSKNRGEWLDPQRGKLKFEQYAWQCFDSAAHLRPGTRLKVRGHLQNYLLPSFGEMPLSAIHPTHVRTFVSELENEGLASGTIAAVYRTFVKIMRTAEIDSLISRSPCVGIDLPRQTSHEEMVFLTPEEIDRLADAIDDRFGTLVYSAAYTGMRWGELAALKVSRLNLLKGTVDVMESLAEINGHFFLQGTKTGARRSLSLPRFLAEMLGEHIGRFSGVDGHVFTAPEGGPLRRTFIRRHFKPAAAAASLDPSFRFHDLRHTCASLLIAQGAHPKEIQERLGHSTIRLTFDRYGHLFPSLDERLREGLEQMFRSAKLHSH
jgi:integrase